MRGKTFFSYRNTIIEKMELNKVKHTNRGGKKGFEIQNQHLCYQGQVCLRTRSKKVSLKTSVFKDPLVLSTTRGPLALNELLLL